MTRYWVACRRPRMRHQDPMASPETNQVSAPSCVATPDALADRAGGDGCHLAPPAPISATVDRVANAIALSVAGAGYGVFLDDPTPQECETLRRSCSWSRRIGDHTTYVAHVAGAGWHVITRPSVPHRNPLTDPRAGDLIRLADGSTLEALDVVLGHGAHVRVREDSSTYRIEHETWRHIAQGATVVFVGGES